MMVARAAAPSRSGLRPALRAPLTGLPVTARRSRAVLRRCRCRERLQHTIVLSVMGSLGVTVDVRPAALPEAAGGVGVTYGLYDGPLTFTLTREEADTATRDAWCTARSGDEAVGVTRQLLPPGSSWPLAGGRVSAPAAAAKQLSTARPRPRVLLQTATPHSIKRLVRWRRAGRATVTTGESGNGSDGTRTRDLRRDSARIGEASI